jgi:transcriptional regulator with XRE-family HTH domain
MLKNGKQIVAARGLLGMTQEELAKLAEVGRTTLNAFEQGLRTPRPQTVEAIRRVLEERGIVFTNGRNPGVAHHPDKATVPA